MGQGTRKTVWLIVSLIFGIGYWFGHGAFGHGPVAIVVKMAGVGALAAYAWHNASLARRPIALVMALGALGDGLIELNLIAGALAFLAGHIVACRFYFGLRRNPRWTDTVLAIPVINAIIIAGVEIVSPSPGTAIYAVGLASMATFAWMSDFRRDRVALGAFMFAASDLLLFARMGPLAQSAVPGLLIWPLYYAGQVLITLGVVGLQGRTTTP